MPTKVDTHSSSSKTDNMTHSNSNVKMPMHSSSSKADNMTHSNSNVKMPMHSSSSKADTMSSTFQCPSVLYMEQNPQMCDPSTSYTMHHMKTRSQTSCTYMTNSPSSLVTQASALNTQRQDAQLGITPQQTQTHQTTYPPHCTGAGSDNMICIIPQSLLHNQEFVAGNVFHTKKCPPSS